MAKQRLRETNFLLNLDTNLNLPKSLCKLSHRVRREKKDPLKFARGKNKGCSLAQGEVRGRRKENSGAGGPRLEYMAGMSSRHRLVLPQQCHQIIRTPETTGAQGLAQVLVETRVATSVIRLASQELCDFKRIWQSCVNPFRDSKS